MSDTGFEKSLAKEFEYINFPESPWVESSPNQYDVVVIGAGMAGLAAAFALKKLGHENIKIFDKSPSSCEGPWTTYARMPTLRSGKDLVGPAQDFPLLTFHAWFKAKYNEDQWNQLGKIPTPLWMEYLCWFREALNLDIENGRTLEGIQPNGQGLTLILDDRRISTKKVVLATGRGGFGGSKYPRFIGKLPRDCYAHTNDAIDFSNLRNKTIGVVGAGASGFDAAAAALEAGALHVDIILRRHEVPYVNKAASLTYSGFLEGYHDLDDEKRWKLMEVCYRKGVPPPYEAVERVMDNPRFSIVRDVSIQDATHASSKVQLETSQGSRSYDYLILATGFEIDISKQPELKSFSDKIQLWSDRTSMRHLPGPDWFYRSPYLGPHFQFLEKNRGEAPFLKHIYCFNYAATLSHGIVSGDIPGIGVGASRLARGITSDLFGEDWDAYYRRLEEFQIPELAPKLR